MKFAFITPKTNERRGELQYIPLGIAYLGSVLQKGGHNIKVIDGRINNYTTKQIIEEIDNYNPNFICASSTTYQIKDNINILKEIKKQFPEIITIVGGAHISAIPNRTLDENNCIDIAIIGEGEETIIDIAKNIGNLEKVKGIAFRKNKKIIQTEPRDFIRDLDKIPFPNRDLFELKKYAKLALEVKRKPMTSIITSRGCPYNCIFCCKSTFGKKFRARSAENVIEEIEQLVNKGFKEIHIVDDTFTMDINRAKKICQIVIDKKYDLKFSLPNGIRANMVDEELFNLMKKAGFYSVFFGVESGDQRVLDNTGKSIDLEKIKYAIKLAKKSGFYVGIYVVIGLPASSIESEMKTLNLALSLDVDQMSFTVITPYPGSRLFSLLEKEGTINKNWNAYRHDFASRKLLYNTSLSKEDVDKIIKIFLKKFYLRPIYPLKLIFRHKMHGIRKIYTMFRSLIMRRYK